MSKQQEPGIASGSKHHDSIVSTYVLQQRFERGCGRVHSVFAHSFNVEVDRFLLHLDGPTDPLSCIGIKVSALLLTNLLQAVEVGNEVAVENKVLSFATRRSYTHLDLNACTPRDLSLSKVEGTAWQRPLAAALEKLDLERSLGLVRDNRFHVAMSVLGQLEASDVALSKAVRFLLGRGLGLTPSGDDLLMGYGIALHLTGQERQFTRVLRATLANQSTDVSIAYLQAMLEGQASEGYCAVMRAAREGTFERFHLLLNSLQQVGHTSGSDGLYGFSVGLRACGVELLLSDERF